MIKILIRSIGNNNYTTIAIERIVDENKNLSHFYWRKINECRTRYIGAYRPDVQMVWQTIFDTVAKAADGEFVGVLS